MEFFFFLTVRILKLFHFSLSCAGWGQGDVVDTSQGAPFMAEGVFWALHVVQSLSRVLSDSLRPHGLQHARLPCPSQSPGVCSNLSIELVIPSNHLILCSSLLLLPSVFPSIRVFSIELALRIRWPKYWSFSFSVSPSSEYSGLISFRIDWFDLLNLAHAIKIRNIKALELTHQRHTLQL